MPLPDNLHAVVHCCQAPRMAAYNLAKGMRPSSWRKQNHSLGLAIPLLPGHMFILGPALCPRHFSPHLEDLGQRDGALGAVHDDLAGTERLTCSELGFSSGPGLRTRVFQGCKGRGRVR